MKKKPTQSIKNRALLLPAIVLLFLGLTNFPERNKGTREITVTLYKDIENITGSKNPSDYRFWTTAYKNRFTIEDGSITGGKHKPISNLKGGQTINLSIAATDYDNLADRTEDSSKDITVIGISHNGNTLMSVDEFYHNRKMYHLRLMVILTFMGLALLLKSLVKVSNKVIYIIVGTFVGLILLMRIFGFGLY